MHNCESLYNLTRKPKINDISLKLLSEYYKKYLLPYKFRYIFDDDKTITLEFKEEHFCHLIGTESIVRKSVSKNMLKNYRGIAGLQRIDKEELTFVQLEKFNKKSFNNVKAKFVYFYLLPKLINTPFAVKFENSKVNPPTSIKCEILFYSKVNNDNAIIHLGIEKGSGEYYFPKTFFVEKVSEFKDDIYIREQTLLTIKNIDIIE